ncbi:MAG: DUF454 domain-containing protein [Desulfitobacterium sp.]|nr:DUF454 domain-containing protein [Desulfitobacterium sp.]
MHKPVLIVLGTIFVVLGFIGMFLPVLPTTPFLLLAAACYMRSSEKLYNKLIENRYFGSYIKDYYEERGIPLHGKIMAMVIMWPSLICSIVFFIDFFWAKVAVGIVGVLVSAYILSLKTKRIDKRKGRVVEEDS